MFRVQPILDSVLRRGWCTARHPPIVSCSRNLIVRWWRDCCELGDYNIQKVNATAAHLIFLYGMSQLTQQEVSFLRILVQQIRSGAVSPESALQNLSKAMSGQGYQVSSQMEIALEVVGRRVGFTKAQFTRMLAPNAPATKQFEPPGELKTAARTKAAGRAFRLLKWGGRIFLVVAIAADTYEIYEAENKAKTITKKAGAWAGAMAAGSVAAAEASPLLGGGPWGWLGYGVITGGAGILGYIAGGEVTETVYEWVWD